jgi:Xaa-Pro aminopeptidase
MSISGMVPGVSEPWPEELRDLAFESDEYHGRVRRVRALMAERGVDLLYVTTPDHVCYLHGYFAGWYKANSPMRYPQFYGTAIHVDSDEFIHFDNPTEAPLLDKTSVSTDNRFFPGRDPDVVLPFVINELRSKGWLGGTVGLERWSYVPNPAVSQMLQQAFEGAGCTVVDASRVVRRVRRVKSPAEISYTEKAVELADVGHDTIRQNLRPGITELELFGEVTAAMMKAGSEFPALIPIFNAVPLRGDRPVSAGHAMAGRKVIQDGEVLKADLSGVYYRYHGNVQRYYVLGDVPAGLADRNRRAAGAFDVFRQQVKAGMTVGEVNGLLRRYYEEVGLWDTPGWALGYELGLSLPPDWVGEFYFNVRDDKYLDRVFEESMVTNFESMFNTPLIDTLVYERDRTRILSRTPFDVDSVI